MWFKNLTLHKSLLDRPIRHFWSPYKTYFRKKWTPFRYWRKGLLRDSNPGPLALEARFIPIDRKPLCRRAKIRCTIRLFFEIFFQVFDLEAHFRVEGVNSPPLPSTPTHSHSYTHQNRLVRGLVRHQIGSDDVICACATMKRLCSWIQGFTAHAQNMHPTHYRCNIIFIYKI